MGANQSTNNTNLGDQAENITPSTAVRNTSEANRRSDDNAFCQWRTHDDDDDVAAAIESTTTAAAADRNASIAWDPITALYELCAARRLGEPVFECGENETSRESRPHVAQCSVTLHDSVVFRAVGAGDRRQVAKRIAAMAVYDSVAGRQVEDASENVASAANGRAAGSSNSSTNELFKITNDHWSSKTIIAADNNSVLTGSETAEESPNKVNLGRAGISVGRPYIRSRRNRNRNRAKRAAVEDLPRLYGPPIDIGRLLEEQRRRLIAFDPVVKIRELCSRCKWEMPEFECSVIEIATANSMSHRNMARCLVRVNDSTFWAESVARTKKAAIRLAAMRAYTELSGRQYQDINPAPRPHY